MYLVDLLQAPRVEILKVLWDLLKAGQVDLLKVGMKVDLLMVSMVHLKVSCHQEL